MKIMRKKILKIINILSVTLVIGSPLFGRNHHLNRKHAIWFSTDGANIIEQWSLKKKLHQCIAPGGQYGSYLLWSPNWVLPGKHGSIIFSARTPNDITVGISNINPWNAKSTGSFYNRLTNAKHLYEIVIGGWANTQSAIRKGRQTDPLTTVPSGIPRNNHGRTVNSLVQYKIVLYQDKEQNADKIGVYFRFPGRKAKWKELMTYTDTSPIKATKNKRWFTFSSWDQNVFYTNIKASTSTKIPHH